MKHSQLDTRLTNWLRIHRKKAGLTQQELEEVLGYTEGSVSRHESFQAEPPLKVAIGYEIVFRLPVTEMFAGLRDEIEKDIEARLAQIEERLGQSDTRGPKAVIIARKLMWLSQRREPDYDPNA